MDKEEQKKELHFLCEKWEEIDNEIDEARTARIKCSKPSDRIAYMNYIFDLMQTRKELFRKFNDLRKKIDQHNDDLCESMMKGIRGSDEFKKTTN